MNAYFKLTWMQLKLFGREPVALGVRIRWGEETKGISHQNGH